MAAARKNPADWLPLSPTQWYVLLALAESDMHGYGIMQSVKARTEGRVRIGPGTLYSALDRMIEYGWIEECDPPEYGDVDARRRYYHLTQYGTRVAEMEAQRLANSVQDARIVGLLGSHPS